MKFKGDIFESKYSPNQKQEDETSLPDGNSYALKWLREKALLIYALGTLAAMTPLKKENLRAAEITPTVSFSEGIDRLHKDTLTARYEELAMFYVNKNTDKNKWIYGVSGENKNISYSPDDLLKSINEQNVLEESGSAVVCEVHTHPVSAAESANLITKDDALGIRNGALHKVSIPPSGADISTWRQARFQKDIIDKISKADFLYEARFGVVDPVGITYYRAITDDDQKREFPEFFTELRQRREIHDDWENTANELIKKLNKAMLDKLHSFTANSGRYEKGRQFDYTEHYKQEEIAKMKQEDIIFDLNLKTEYSRKLADELIGDNLAVRELYDKFVDRVLSALNKDRDIFKRTKDDWIRASIDRGVEELLNSSYYARLRAAYARNGSYIRFVPHAKAMLEPPCAGADYK